MSIVIGFPVTTVHRYQKLMQYVQETTYATTPTSAAFVDASIINSTKTTYENATETYRKLGKRQLYKLIKMGVMFPWSCSFSPVDTSLIRYGTENGNNAGTLTGTIDFGLTFVNSIFANSGGTLTEYFILRKGSKCDSITVTTTSKGMVTVDMNWLSSDITAVTTALGGLTTPTFVVTPTTATPWSNLVGGASKLSLNDGSGAVIYPFKSASFTVSNNLDPVDIDGSAAIQALEPTVKQTTFNCEVIVQKDLKIEAAIAAGTSMALILTLNSTGPKTATGNWFPTRKEEGDSSDETKVRTVNYSGELDDVSVSA
jgi:hypothetical protein